MQHEVSDSSSAIEQVHEGPRSAFVTVTYAVGKEGMEMTPGATPVGWSDNGSPIVEEDSSALGGVLSSVIEEPKKRSDADLQAAARKKDSVQIRRKIKANLNKLTIEKFVPIAERIAELLETCCSEQIPDFTDLIVDTALAEHALSEMYCDLLAVLRFRCVPRVQGRELSDDAVHHGNDSSLATQEPVTSQCNPIQMALAHKLLNEYQRLAATELEDSNPEEDEARSKAKMVALFVLTGHLFNARLIGYNFLSKIVSQVLTLREAEKAKKAAQDVAECVCRLLLTVGANLESANEVGRCLLETILLRLEPLIESGCSQRDLFWYQEMNDARSRDWVKRSYASRPKKLDEANKALFRRDATVGVERHGHRRFMTEGSAYANYINAQERAWLSAQMPGAASSRSDLNESDLRFSQVSFSNPLDCAWLYNPEHPPNARSVDYTDSSLLDSAADSPTGSETVRSGPRKRPATPMQRCRVSDDDSEEGQSAKPQDLGASAHSVRPILTSEEEADDEREGKSSSSAEEARDDGIHDLLHQDTKKLPNRNKDPTSTDSGN